MNAFLIKMKLTPQQRLKICIIGQFLLLIAILIPTILLAHNGSTYYRFGPNDELTLISVKINTSLRYGILLVYIFIFRVCKAFVQELGMPILSFNIYDPNKKVVTGFTRKELQIQANLMYTLNAIRWALEIQLAIVQIDIAIISAVFQEIASIPTIYLLLKEKEFKPNVETEIEKAKEQEITYFQL
tara:strand:- start:90 stop:647 length:558 start_codon:yes stop_codon:yes gene_type:complete